MIYLGVFVFFFGSLLIKDSCLKIKLYIWLLYMYRLQILYIKFFEYFGVFSEYYLYKYLFKIKENM